MLVRLFGRNFRSLKNDFELSLVAADLTRKDDAERGVIEVPILGSDTPLRLLRTIAIYGSNASGKSTVLLAANALRWLSTESSAHSKPDARIPSYEPFLLDNVSKAAPTFLGCDVIFKSSILRYEIEFSAKEIKVERLTLLNENDEPKVLLHRQRDEIAGDLIAENDANRLYVTGMQPNVAVLSKLAQHGPQKGKGSALPYYKAIRDATWHENYTHGAMNILRLGDDRFADDTVYRNWIMQNLITAADVGIREVKTRREELDFPAKIKKAFEESSDGTKVPSSRIVVNFIHEGEVGTPLDFEDESAGTKKLFNLSADWWRLANEQVTLLADELSASLHPRLLNQIIRTVNEAPSRVSSQLVFATHDTGLLESHDGLPPALRRDQVYFTKKSSDGATELYSLAEFKDDARPVHNIRKRYLSGLYGAIPSVERLSL